MPAFSPLRSHRQRRRLRAWLLPGIIIVIALCGVGVWALTQRDKQDTAIVQDPKSTDSSNPLHNRTLYKDGSRQVAMAARQYPELQAIASQPGATWLIGPSVSDQQADRDIAAVRRTSQAAAAQDTLPVYVLYAIPQRDACAPYSGGGFASSAAYLEWIRALTGALQSDAVFVVEPDAIAHTMQAGCMTAAEVTERLTLLSQAVDALKASSRSISVYLDAGHSEWFTDPAVLAEPLRGAGIARADGVAVNVSNYIATPVITEWAQRLVQVVAVPDKRLGVVIDTSRNGQGAPPAEVKGDARWCNPAGRGLGKRPTTATGVAGVDAYLWIKNVGESDGDCFGNPPAGTFNVPKALELVRNAE